MIGNQLTSVLVLLAIATLAASKPPPPPGAPWAKYAGKPVFERSLGPPPISGISTISVPYMPKSAMFPKFVDPRIMIAKKTDLLSNLFGGLGPAIGTPGFGSASPYPGYGSSPYTSYPSFMYEPEEIDGDSTSGDTEADSDLPMLYGSSLASKTKYFDSTATTGLKRGLYGPFGPKIPMSGPFFGASDSTDTSGTAGGFPFSRRGILGPKVTPFSSSSSGLTDPFAGKIKKTDGISKTEESSTDRTGPEVKITTQEPPPYPKIPTIPEETGESDKETGNSALEKIFASSGDSKSSKDLSKRMVADDSVPKEYLPGMFGPMFGPPSAGAFGPSPGILGPGAFMGKKSVFLDTLFKNLATSTPSTAVTDIPVTEKSTIVPPGFWLPASVIPDPGAYNAKVETFLDKLFESLKLNVSGTTASDSPGQTLTYEESISAGFPAGGTPSARSLPMDYSGASAKSVRALADPEAVINAKDQIANSIIGELRFLKDDMMSTFNEFIIYQKNLSSPAPGTKPFKPFAPPFWSAGSGSAASDMGILPYKQRMAVLGEVFDMLTDLQMNVSAAVNDAVKSSYSEESPETEVQITTTAKPEVPILDSSVLDAIQAKLADLNTVGLTKAGPKGGFTSKFSRALPPSPTSFWVAYPGGDSARRSLNEDQEIPRSNGHQDFAEENEDGMMNSGKDSRAIKMQMHQGYQSFPPGTIQSIQAGGGSVPGHEGGGVKFLGAPQDYQDYKKSWEDWSKTMAEEWKNENGHRHHNHH